MAFPSSPTNGELATVNQIIYQYNSAYQSWTRIVAGVDNLTVNTISILSNVSIGNRGVPTSFVGNTAPTTPAPVIGDLWYYPPTDKTFKYNYDGTSYQWIDTGLATTIDFVSVTANLILPSISTVSNIGTTGARFDTVHAKATSAQYADLAERYLSDKPYGPGVVVVFGGKAEITTSDISHDPRIAGVISTDPAYLMNDGTKGLAVALTGRVPCLVVGNINKGDRLVNSNISGVATALNSQEFQPGCILGKSLMNYSSDEVGTIEVAVGRH